MKLALLSDIHSNLNALQSCLNHARDHGAQQIAFLGDLVGYGGQPGQVLERVMDLAQMGALVVQGNHDALVGGAPGQPQSMANVSVPWTRSQLSAQQQAFLRDLPLTARVGDVLLVHASARFPEKWYYVEDALTAGASLDAAQTEDDSVRFVFGGHVHRQSLYYRSTGRGLMLFNPTPGVAVPTPRHREWIATVGSVGQPRDGNPRAQYAMFDTDKAQLTFFRVEYDLQAAAAAIRQAGLLDFFAQRLEEGI